MKISEIPRPSQKAAVRALLRGVGAELYGSPEQDLDLFKLPKDFSDRKIADLRERIPYVTYPDGASRSLLAKRYSDDLFAVAYNLPRKLTTPIANVTIQTWRDEDDRITLAMIWIEGTDGSHFSRSIYKGEDPAAVAQGYLRRGVTDVKCHDEEGKTDPSKVRRRRTVKLVEGDAELPKAGPLRSTGGRRWGGTRRTPAKKSRAGRAG